MHDYARRAFCPLLLLVLSACGGGGGGGSSTPPPPTPQPGSVQLSAAELAVDEDAGSAQLTITRTGGSDGAITVRVRTSGSSAGAIVDYTEVDATVSFAAGDATPKVVTVPIIEDGN